MPKCGWDDGSMVATSRYRLTEYGIEFVIAVRRSNPLRVPQESTLMDYLERIAVAIESTFPLNAVPLSRDLGVGVATSCLG